MPNDTEVDTPPVRCDSSFVPYDATEDGAPPLPTDPPLTNPPGDPYGEWIDREPVT